MQDDQPFLDGAVVARQEASKLEVPKARLAEREGERRCRFELEWNLASLNANGPRDVLGIELKTAAYGPFLDSFEDPLEVDECGDRHAQARRHA